MTNQEAVRGTLKRVHREKGSWFAGTLETADKQLVSIAGVASAGIPQIGCELELTGEASTHPVYGKQFKFRTLKSVLPSTREGTLRFLATFPGIGPGKAAKIWDAWGAEAAQIITDTPSRLSEIKGLGGLVEAVGADVLERADSIRVETLLCNMGFGERTREKIREEFGDGLSRVLEENPYKLVRVARVSFSQVDNAVMALGQFPVESPFRAAAAVLQSLKDESDNGHTWVEAGNVPELLGKMKLTYPIPSDAIERGIANATEHGMIRRIIGDGEAVIGYAVPFLAKAEENIAATLAAMLREPAPLGRFDAIPEAMREALTDAQKVAVLMAIEHRVAVLTGGPGTGKTYVTKSIIAAIRSAIEAREIVIVAPTGKAAKRANEVTGNEAMTMHRLAGMLGNTGSDDEQPRFVIVDESSMADVETLDMLLRALTRSDLRILFVGDVDQLPSVGPGRVLADLIASGAVPVTRLTEVMRQAAESRIIANAHLLNSGRAMNHEITPREDWFAVLGVNEGTDLESLADRIVRTAIRAEEKWGYSMMRGEILVLAGQRAHKVLGVKALNAKMRFVFNPPTGDGRELYGFRVGDRVLVTANDYSLGVVNGDVGIVSSLALRTDKDMEGNPEKPAVWVRLDGAGEVKIPDAKISTLQLAFAMTVHKAQGSEAPFVIVVAHTCMGWALQRPLLYTAITRAKERVCVVSTAKALGIATAKADAGRRFTRLAGLVRSAAAGMGVAK